MGQRDRAAKKAKRHGTWGGTHRAQRKHRASVIKHRHRALRREGRETVREALEKGARPPGIVGHTVTTFLVDEPGELS